MWIYSQTTGRLMKDADYVGTGYSGYGIGKNNPAKQDTPRVGPLPQGLYAFSGPIDTLSHGPCVLMLTPDKSNVMYGRSGFLIHGDNRRNPGSASNGCIILDRAIREMLGRSRDRDLTVVL